MLKQVVERCLVEERQVTGQYQPRCLRVRSLGGRNAGNRSHSLMAVDDGGKAATQRIGQLVGAYRHKTLLANLARQLESAMQLPDEQRAALATALIESLDHSVDEDAEAAWSSEIARRLHDVESGRVQTIPWLEARQLIAADEQPDV